MSNLAIDHEKAEYKRRVEAITSVIECPCRDEYNYDLENLEQVESKLTDIMYESAKENQALKEEVSRLGEERRVNALEGQATLDTLNNQLTKAKKGLNKIVYSDVTGYTSKRFAKQTLKDIESEDGK